MRTHGSAYKSLANRAARSIATHTGASPEECSVTMLPRGFEVLHARADTGMEVSLRYSQRDICIVVKNSAPSIERSAIVQADVKGRIQIEALSRCSAEPLGKAGRQILTHFLGPS